MLKVLCQNQILTQITIAVSQPAQKTPDDLGKSTANIIRGSVYKNTHNNPLDTLAESLSSESPMTKALIDTTGNTIGISNVLQATCDMSANAIKSASYKETENLINLARIIKSWFSLAHYRSLQPLYIWWARERMDKAVQRALPNRELDIMIINGEYNSFFVLHSETEYCLSSKFLGCEIVGQ